MDKTQKMKPRNVLDDAVKFNFTKSQPLHSFVLFFVTK